ncbi:hypothetical protein [Streptomyces sp. P9-A4]|uniref:hypothetical protein n=1 Tax=Streptomyces sp. P9-A4 TaxID=3072285 RepID=UPI002FCA99B1
MAAQKILGTRGWAKAVAALAMTLTALVAAPGAAGAAGTAGGAAGGGEFAAQARTAGLTGAQAKSLQKRVDGYLASTGGTQVAANKIALPGGELLLTLPGERKARDLDATAVPGDTVGTCRYSYVCAYKFENYTGDQFDMFTCNHLFRIEWNTTGSWINNQRSDLYADFYDKTKVIRWTSPGGLSYDSQADWRWVWYVSPC